MTENTTAMRVLMTGDTVGGVWTFALELAEALGAYGVEVLLAAMGGQPSDAQREDAARIPNLQTAYSDYKLEWMEDPWRDVEASAEWLRDLEACFAPDVIHCNTFGYGTAGSGAPVVLTAHSCVLSWWRAVHQEVAPGDWDRYRETVVRALESAHLVTAPSQSMLESLQSNYGLLPRGRVIANGRNTARFRPLAKQPFILSAGRLWDKGKNVGMLSGISGKLPWPIYLAGEPKHPDGGTAELEGCRPLGQLGPAKLSEWYGRAAIYALPARYEPFGLSVLEAALAGCALVLSDIPSLREIWQDAAAFVPPHDASVWTEQLRLLTGDAAARQDLGVRARLRALEFTPQRMAREYLSCYLQAIRQSEAICVS